jgi:very-short-patch-repair endonuclease
VNVLVCGFEVDAYWPEHRLVVELDGARSHRGSDRVAADRARELALREAGLHVRRFSWHQIVREENRVAGDVLATLASANPRQDSAAPG